MRDLFKILMFSIVAMLCACGSKDKFEIEGTLAGGETQSLRFIYYGDGAVKVIPGAARDGKFKVEGVSAEPAIVDILANDGRVIGRVFAANGDRITCNLNRTAPWEIEVEGTDENVRWSGFIRDNAGAYSKADTAAVNSAIASYIKSHPDDVVSTLLLVTGYDCHEDPTSATHLLEAINPEVRPMSLAGPLVTMLSGVSSRPDSIGAFRYYYNADTLRLFDRRKAQVSLISFTAAADGAGRADSILRMLRSSRKDFSKGKLQILDLGLSTDSFTWRRSTRPDSAVWQQGWLPGSVATKGLENAAVGRLPWFVVSDSSGLILYRGSSASAARSAIDNILR